MKITSRCAVLPFLFFAAGLTSAAFAQGTLTPPPGLPAPTMKSLDQIEARTIVNATNTPGDATNTFIISQPGSYYLAGNLTGVAGKHGIRIQASDVTLDLNGFTLTGPGTGGTVTTGLRGVITSATATNSCIRNGSARNWYGGVEASAAGMLVEKLRLYGNSTGLSVGNGSIVRDCVATSNLQYGFLIGDRTQLNNCIASENAESGFFCADYVSLLDCTASRNGGAGFAVQGSCSLLRCSATRNVNYGIAASEGCTIGECTASNNTLGGIYTSGSSVTHCVTTNNTGYGISAYSSSVTNCSARLNGSTGITNQFGVVAFCVAMQNNSGNAAGDQIGVIDCTLTGNYPAQ